MSTTHRPWREPCYHITSDHDASRREDDRSGGSGDEVVSAVVVWGWYWGWLGWNLFAPIHRSAASLLEARIASIASWNARLNMRGAANDTRVTPPCWRMGASPSTPTECSRSYAHRVHSAPPSECPVTTTSLVGYSSCSIATCRRMCARGPSPVASRPASPARVVERFCGGVVWCGVWCGVVWCGEEGVWSFTVCSPCALRGAWPGTVGETRHQSGRRPVGIVPGCTGQRQEMGTYLNHRISRNGSIEGGSERGGRR